MKYISYMFFFLLLTGCKSMTGEAPRSVGEETSFLALGDSYTIGESVDQKFRWPVQLAEALRKRGYPLGDPKIIAKTGWTTGDLLQAMDAELGDEQYDLVSVLIGVNNQYQGRSVSEYEDDLHKIFRQAIRVSKNGRDGVFVVSIPDYGATPFGSSKAAEIAAEIDQFNAIFEKVAQEYELPFYNITPISRTAVSDPELTAEDDLHPSGKMYRLWVEEIAKQVATLL